MSLTDRIHSLAEGFASQLLQELLTGSLADLTGGAPAVSRREKVASKASPPSGRKAGRLPRRTPEAIQEFIGQIVATVRKAGAEGARAEHIRQALECEARELPRALKQALSEGALKSTGQKRATTYFVGAGASKRKIKTKAVKAHVAKKKQKSTKKK